MEQKVCSLTIRGETKQYPLDTTFQQIADEYQKQFENKIVLVKFQNDLKELSQSVLRDGSLEFVTADQKPGKDTYRRSLTLLMETAAWKLYPNLELLVQHSIGQGYYCEFRHKDAICVPDRKMLSSLKEKMQAGQTNEAVPSKKGTAVYSCIVFLFLFAVMGYLYYRILRPFEKLQGFAENIAQGNFDVPLKYERSNYFGAFTWAFDSMRKEIIKARAAEREAVENNKTVIATLSHDIKTPVASIRAYAEGLAAYMDTTLEKRMKFAEVIIRKCDEVSALTNDLFLHALSDMDKLEMNMHEVKLCAFMRKAVAELISDMDSVRLYLPDSEWVISADEKRLMQLTENILNNAAKYGEMPVDITIRQKDNDTVQINFKDYGNGMKDEDIPFALDKFYRGKNSAYKPGAGLGLYIVKYITNKMSGEVRLYNHADGLEVVVELPVKG